MRKHLIIAMLAFAVISAACGKTQAQAGDTTPDTEDLYQSFRATVLDETGVEYPKTEEEWRDLMIHFCRFLDRYDTAEGMISATIDSMIAEGVPSSEVEYRAVVYDAQAVAASVMCPWHSTKFDAWASR